MPLLPVHCSHHTTETTLTSTGSPALSRRTRCLFAPVNRSRKRQFHQKANYCGRICFSLVPPLHAWLQSITVALHLSRHGQRHATRPRWTPKREREKSQRLSVQEYQTERSDEGEGGGGGVRQNTMRERRALSKDIATPWQALSSGSCPRYSITSLTRSVKSQASSILKRRLATPRSRQDTASHAIRLGHQGRPRTDFERLRGFHW